MTHLIEVAFTGNRKAFFLWEGDAPPPVRTPVIVEADRGEDLGHVHAIGELAETRCTGCSHGCGTTTRPTERALRVASAAERARAATLRDENQAARRTTHEQVRAAGLIMKITDAEWQWDRRKLTIYFTAEKRVDFRTLVRDLASTFRTRIELKQIGVRDEAKRLSGIGRCGREYCSSSWLPDLRPVNLGVAKDQRLSLNPTQISGACGRLMCCLRYEHDFYVQSRRRFPKEGKILRTHLGEEKVIASDIFRDTVTLRTVDGDTRVVPLTTLREQVAAGDLPPELPAAASKVPVAARGPGAGHVAPPEPVAPHTRAAPDQVDTLDTVDEFGPNIAVHDGFQAIDRDADEGPDDTDDRDATEARDAHADGPTASPESGDEAIQRRKRRRGRRGGRRVRGDRGTPPTPPSTDA